MYVCVPCVISLQWSSEDKSLVPTPSSFPNSITKKSNLTHKALGGVQHSNLNVIELRNLVDTYLSTLSLFKCLFLWPHTFKGHLVSISRSEICTLHSHITKFLSLSWLRGLPFLKGKMISLSFWSFFKCHEIGKKKGLPWPLILLSLTMSPFSISQETCVLEKHFLWKKKVMDRRLKQVWKCLSAKETQEVTREGDQIPWKFTFSSCIKMAEFNIHWQELKSRNLPDSGDTCL